VLTTQYRRAFAFRAGALLLAGFVITFSVEWHDTIVSEILFAASILVTALAEMLSYRLGKSTSKIPARALLHGLLAVLAAVVLILTLGDFSVLNITVLIWAALTAVIEIASGWRSSDAAFARDLRITGLFAGLLALLLLLIPGNPVSVIGLYGGYSFVAGVYLAIAAVDRPKRSVTESRA